MDCQAFDIEGKEVGSVTLPEDVFAVDVNEALLWEQVKAQRASSRRGTHSTKTRGEVRGGGAKPFKQKGGGRARQGSIRSPLMPGGGTTFGPKPRDYSYRLPRGARRSALRSALSLKAKDGLVCVLSAPSFEKPSTKAVQAFLDKIGESNVLIVSDDNENFAKSIRNLAKSNCNTTVSLNVYEILKHKKLVIVQGCLDGVVARARKQNTTFVANKNEGEA